MIQVSWISQQVAVGCPLSSKAGMYFLYNYRCIYDFHIGLNSSFSFKHARDTELRDLFVAKEGLEELSEGFIHQWRFESPTDKTYLRSFRIIFCSCIFIYPIRIYNVGH